MNTDQEIPKRPTPGINVANVLDRLRFETNKAQKNALIDKTIEQVRKDYAAMTSLCDALEALAEWGRTYTSPRDQNSPHELLIAAMWAIDSFKGGHQ